MALGQQLASAKVNGRALEGGATDVDAEDFHA
jgi:hypothetical protein